MVILCLSLSTSLLAILLSFFLLREQKRLKQQVQQLVAAQVVTEHSFGGRLSHAQNSLHGQMQESSSESGAQRYGKVAQLLRQGLTAQEIAEVLQLPETEVEQLLALARLQPTLAEVGN
jgi:DNA-binding NarL/FixJ family response regulator